MTSELWSLAGSPSQVCNPCFGPSPKRINATDWTLRQQSNGLTLTAWIW